MTYNDTIVLSFTLFQYIVYRIYTLICNFYTNIQQHVSREPLDGKTWFQAHIVEHLKCYPMVVESWKSVQANLNVPLFARGTFSSACE